MDGPELWMVMASALLHAVWSASIKGSGDPVAFNVLQGSLTVAVGAMLTPWMALPELGAQVWLLLAATGVAHGLYWYGLSRTLDESDLSLAYPIIRSTPALLPFIAVPLLGEQLSLVGGLGIAIVASGIWVLQGTAPRGPRGGRGLQLAYFTLATTVAYSLLDKQVMAQVSASPWRGELPRSAVMYLLISFTGWLGFLPLALRRLRREQLLEAWRRHRVRSMAAASIGFVGYGLILEAYRTAPASYVVAVRQMSVLFALGIAVTLLGEHTTWRRLLGGIATVTGVVMIALWG
ncbi:MAG: EamA family transporter [bacterium]|nr:EamA family transporter [bacterium]